ncbi:unnamed protein product [Rotaria sp. Silwood1]|nr:unnamed protein product [Rotaria sp. Silwood1]
MYKIRQASFNFFCSAFVKHLIQQFCRTTSTIVSIFKIKKNYFYPLELVKQLVQQFAPKPGQNEGINFGRE